MKYLIIFLIFTLTSCNSKTEDNGNVVKKKIESEIKVEFNLLETVIKNLNLKKENCRLDLVATKINPNNSEETIIAIPEISKRDVEDAYYFEFNSHILIVDTSSGKIKNKYIESSKTNNWISDAVLMADIKIDTAPYVLSNNRRAFGVRVNYYNNSKPNPYSYESISLFLKTDNSLNKVLDNFHTMEYGGEWDTNCYGEFIKEERLLIISEIKTNGYFNILVKNKIAEIKNYINKNNDCDTTEKKTIQKTTLKYNGKEYK